MKKPGIPCLLQMAAAKVTDCSGWTRCFLMHTPKSRCCALSSRNSAHTQQLFKRHQTVQDGWATFLTKARGWGWQCRLRNCLKAQAVRCTHSPTLLLAWHPCSVFNSRNDSAGDCSHCSPWELFSWNIVLDERLWGQNQTGIFLKYFAKLSFSSEQHSPNTLLLLMWLLISG